MKTINVKASNEYDVIIGENLLSNVGSYLKDKFNVEKSVIITDDIVDSLYSQVIEKSLFEIDIEVFKYVIENGEQSKNGYNFL